MDYGDFRVAAPEPPFLLLPIGLPSRGLELAMTVTIEVRRCDVAAKLSGTSVALAIMCTRPRLFDGY